MFKPQTTPLWYRVAELRPRLRPHIRITRQHYRDELWYLLEDEAHNRFHRFRPTGYAAVALMDGEHTVDAIWRSLAQRGEECPTQDEIVQLLAQLDSADLLASDRRPDFLELAHRARTNKRRTWLRRLTSPLFVQIPLLDPDRFLTATAPWVRIFWSPAGFLLWLVIVGWGATQAWLHWGALAEDVSDRVLATDNIVILILVFPILKVLHELGHGYATKIFGGQVHEAGVLTMALLPMPYVDVTSSTRFPAMRRAIVGAAGMMVELVCATLALAIWLRVEPGPLRAAAFNVMLIAGVSTLIFNGNPLLRFDAYYIFSDLMGLTNLATRAGRFYIHLINRYLFGVRSAVSPADTGWERFWFAVYAPASFGYRMVVLFSIALFLAGLWRGVGAALAIWTLFLSLLFPIGKAIFYVLRSPSLRPRRVRAISVTAASVALGGWLLFALPLPFGTVAQGVVSMPDQSEVHIGVEGHLDALLRSNGEAVEKGQPLAIISDRLLQDRAHLLETQMREVTLRYQAVEGKDEVQARMMREQMSYFQAALRDIGDRLAQLTVVGPGAGTFMVDEPQDLPGRFMKRGELVGYVVSEKGAQIRVVVPQSEIDLVRQDTAGVDMRFASDPFVVHRVAAVEREVPTATRTLPSAALSVPGGGPISVDPSDQKKLKSIEVVFEVDLPIPEGVAVDRLGQRVIVRFDHGARTIAWQLSRKIRQLFLERFEL